MPNAIVAMPTSRKKIRNLAMTIRKLTGNKPYFDIIKFIELILPKIDSEFNGMDIVADEQLPNCYAQACPAEHKIFVRNSVYDGAADGNGRDRFTLAHELGHYILNGSTKVSYARVQSKSQIPAYRNPEWQANTFAAELLVPEYIARTINVKKIPNLCGVSMQVANIQKNQILKENHIELTQS